MRRISLTNRKERSVSRNNLESNGKNNINSNDFLQNNDENAEQNAFDNTFIYNSNNRNLPNENIDNSNNFHNQMQEHFENIRERKQNFNQNLQTPNDITNDSFGTARFANSENNRSHETHSFDDSGSLVAHKQGWGSFLINKIYDTLVGSRQFPKILNMEHILSNIMESDSFESAGSSISF